MLSSVFEIVSPKYTGPFDVLLSAIKDNEIDIFEISIAQITSAYFEYLRSIEILNINSASEFLLMASMLLEMKSKKLLPQPEEIALQLENEEIEGELAAHLEEYKMFKQLAETLKIKKESFKKVYSRYHREVAGPVNKDFYLKDVSLQDLVLAFKRVWDAIGVVEEDTRMIIKEEDITLPQRISEVIELLKDKTDGIEFEKLFIRRTRLEVVVTFLAVLELAKRNSIKIVQGVKFGGIRIFKA